MTLGFNEWNKINEASFFDKAKRWISSFFSGDFSKLEDLASDYKSSEMTFVEKWDDIHIEMDKLKLEREQTKSDPAEVKKIDRLLTRNEQLIAAQSKMHEKKSDMIFDKVKSILNKNSKLKEYWEKIKAEIDSEVAEEMYRRVKKMTDHTIGDELYLKYKDSVLKAKKKDEEFREKYGDMMSNINLSIQRPGDNYKRRDDYRGDFIASDDESSFEVLSKLPISDFTYTVKEFTKSECKKLLDFLIKERNDKYLSMDTERDLLNKEIEKLDSPEEKRKIAPKRLKEIREKYMAEIRALRSKITVARKYA